MNMLPPVNVSAIKVRRDMRDVSNRMRAALLCPAMAIPFEPGEGGSVSQTMTFELDPIPGRVITPIYAEVHSVFVPAQAIDAIKAPTEPYAGVTEVLRQKYLNDEVVFDLEPDNEIAQRSGIVPIRIANVLQTNEAFRLAYNAAVNFLRRSKYAYALEVAHTSTAILPALVSQTILERLNGVLDPDDRINGQVNLSLPSVDLPIDGIYTQATTSVRSAGNAYRGYDAAHDITNSAAPSATAVSRAGGDAIGNDPAIRVKGSPGSTRPDLKAIFSGIDAGNVSLVDFYNAQRQDEIARQMRAIVDGNPIDGEAQIMRWAHGFRMEPGRNPILVHHSQKVFGMDYREATDGPSLQDDLSMSKMMQQIGFNAIIPTTELGGVLVTIVTLKPDEIILNQPHPIGSKPWGKRNRISEQMRLDPVPVTMREISADVPTGNETTVALYTGHNALAQMYSHYGFGRNLDPLDVENKTAIWQYAIPASVTPENINYPTDFDQSIFADTLAEVCRYRCSSMATISTPIVFGPTPVEELDVIDTEDLFDLVPE